jgi:hypothetical protein
MHRTVSILPAFLAAMTCAYAAAPDSIFGFYALRQAYCYDQPTAADTHARRCDGQMVSRALVLPHPSEQIAVDVLMFGATGNSCRFEGVGEWRDDHVLVREFVEGQVCELTVRFHNDRLSLSDMNPECASRFCTSGARFGGKQLPKRGGI